MWPKSNIMHSEVPHLERKESLEKIETVVMQGLQKAFSLYNSLSEKGKETVQKNQFGDTALKLDIGSEKFIIDYLKEINLPIRVISEEHGVTEIGDNPKYLGIMDGLDGSNVYKKEKEGEKGRYGTMFGIFESADPSYKDYLHWNVLEKKILKSPYPMD